jgi:ADP-ribose pyrophosphatase
VYKGKVVELRVDEIIEPGGLRATRELVCHTGSVVVLARLPDGRFLLVRQFRYAAGQALWELVAGGLEPGETTEEAGHRELLEETGYKASRVTPLFSFYPSPGILAERMFLVKARGLTRAKAHPDEDERIRVGRFTLTQLRQMLRTNKIRDGKTMAALYWLLSQRPRSRV